MNRYVILNAGLGSWAFAELASNLSRELKIEVSETPGDYNYILSWDETDRQTLDKSFIPFQAMKLASDKRLLAKVFKENNIPIPDTHLLNSKREVIDFVDSNFGQWCIKYPVSCGASGHKIINNIIDISENWLKPYVIQKFIYLDNPIVYRIYCANKKLFGWNLRKFPKSLNQKPWVAHAQGAVYEVLNTIPSEIIDIAIRTFKATYLYNSFGCADLIQDNNEHWLVLEVGTDGIYNYVDRNIGNYNLEEEIARNIANAFWLNM